MNLETGKIEFLDDIEGLESADAMKKYVAVDDEMMTDKQKANMQVSKHDNKSYLGHMFTEHRKEMGERKSRSAKEMSKAKAKRKAAKKARKEGRK